MTTTVWFREDLRSTDNTALHNAAKHAGMKGIIAIYFITDSFWQRHHMATARQRFLADGLQILSKTLAEKNIALTVIQSKNDHDIPQLLYQFMKDNSSDKLFFNKQYELDELMRDREITEYLLERNIEVFSFDDQIVFPPDTIQAQTGTAFKVFTPYKRAWIKHAYQKNLPVLLPAPKKQSHMHNTPSTINWQPKTDTNISLWPAGEFAAQKRLAEFIHSKISHYHETRDFPALDGTSKLSPYLSTGMISPRQCFHAALQYNQGEFDSGNKGAVTWISELIWREFYKHILIAFPRVSKNKAFKPETDQIAWDYNEKFLLAWQQGMTGFPFVDAAMRQLNTTGWMHNRLRMVVAMFLSKTLFLDWRLGEKYFIEKLIDGDLAANNGGWQWCASTGVDAAPYFRIFNPLRQSEHFDPDGKFIRQYCPELAHLDNKSIHQPYKYFDLFSQPLNYPRPIIDHTIAKERVLQAFKKLR